MLQWCKPHCYVLIGTVFNGLSRYVDYVDGSVMFDGRFNDVTRKEVGSVLKINKILKKCLGLDLNGKLRQDLDVCSSSGLTRLAICEMNMEVHGCYKNEDITSFITSIMTQEINTEVV